MDRKLIKQIDQEIEAITEQGLQKSNIEILGQLIDMKKDICMTEEYEKGGKNMEYRDGNYERRGEYREGGSNRMYKEYGDEYSDERYERRGVKGTGRGRRRYRGDDMLEEMSYHYGNYSEGREQYGGDDETLKSFKYMLKSFKDYYKHLKEEAKSKEEVRMLEEVAREISEM